MGLLREAGLVTSGRGHAGGWRLAGDLSAITVGRVHTALGSPALFAVGFGTSASECLVEQAVNGALRSSIADAEALLLARLGDITLAELAADVVARQAVRQRA